MSKLICFDMRVGRRVDVRGVEYRVNKFSRTAARLRLEAVKKGSNAPDLTYTADQFAALLVTEEAELVDELDEPDQKQRKSRAVTDLSNLSLHRVIDWLVKIFLLRQMMCMRGFSPNGKTLVGHYEEVRLWLDEWFKSAGISDVPMPTCWTTYQDLRRWRRHRYSLAAVQTKGLEYTPWEKNSDFYKLARKLAQEQGMSNPTLSAANLHRAVNDQLASTSRASNESEHG